MLSKKIKIEEIEYTVTAAKKQDVPLAYAIKAVHPDGKASHEHSVTIGAVNSTGVPTLAQVQAALDRARQHGAEMAHVAHRFNEIAGELI